MSRTTIRGTRKNDKLTGTVLHDYLIGGRGADRMEGLAGNDWYSVDNIGDRVIEQADGWGDTVVSSISYVLPEHVEDLILEEGSAARNGTGNGLDNVIKGNSRDNQLRGGDGGDELLGFDGDDRLEGGSGGDRLEGGAGDDTLDGGVGDDLLVGDAGIDTFFGGAGHDWIISSSQTANGLGNDFAYGGSGDDAYYISDGDSVVEFAGEGNDYVWLFGNQGFDDDPPISRNLVVFDHVERMHFWGIDHATIVGNALDNSIFGDEGNDILDGKEGVDILAGEEGDDVITDTRGNGALRGHLGADVLTGGAANQIFFGGSGNDAIDTGGGNDIIALHSRDGQDTVIARDGEGTLSLATIRYTDLLFSKSGDDLVLGTGGSNRTTLQGWYAADANKGISRLQMIIDTISGQYSPTSGDPLRDNRIEQFDFAGLAGAARLSSRRE
jgi:Ca2+-binding RTX toxin-like protein